MSVFHTNKLLELPFLAVLLRIQSFLKSKPQTTMDELSLSLDEMRQKAGFPLSCLNTLRIIIECDAGLTLFSKLFWVTIGIGREYF